MVHIELTGGTKTSSSLDSNQIRRLRRFFDFGIGLSSKLSATIFSSDLSVDDPAADCVSITPAF